MPGKRASKPKAAGTPANDELKAMESGTAAESPTIDRTHAATPSHGKTPAKSQSKTRTPAKTPKNKEKPPAKTPSKKSVKEKKDRPGKTPKEAKKGKHEKEAKDGKNEKEDKTKKNEKDEKEENGSKPNIALIEVIDDIPVDKKAKANVDKKEKDLKKKEAKKEMGKGKVSEKQAKGSKKEKKPKKSDIVTKQTSNAAVLTKQGDFGLVTHYHEGAAAKDKDGELVTEEDQGLVTKDGVGLISIEGGAATKEGGLVSKKPDVVTITKGAGDTDGNALVTKGQPDADGLVTKGEGNEGLVTNKNGLVTNEATGPTRRLVTVAPGAGDVVTVQDGQHTDEAKSKKKCDLKEMVMNFPNGFACCAKCNINIKYGSLISLVTLVGFIALDWTVSYYADGYDVTLMHVYESFVMLGILSALVIQCIGVFGKVKRWGAGLHVLPVVLVAFSMTMTVAKLIVSSATTAKCSGGGLFDNNRKLCGDSQKFLLAAVMYTVVVLLVHGWTLWTCLHCYMSVLAERM